MKTIAEQHRQLYPGEKFKQLEKLREVLYDQPFFVCDASDEDVIVHSYFKTDKYPRAAGTENTLLIAIEEPKKLLWFKWNDPVLVGEIQFAFKQDTDHLGFLTLFLYHGPNTVSGKMMADMHILRPVLQKAFPDCTIAFSTKNMTVSAA